MKLYCLQLHVRGFVDMGNFEHLHILAVTYRPFSKADKFLVS
jgi:hypothetical protein